MLRTISLAVFVLLMEVSTATIGLNAEEPTFSAADLAWFEKEVRPLLVEHCYECHSGAEQKGGLSVTSREQMLEGGDSGPAISMESSDDSLFLNAIRYDTGELQMPPQGRLPESAIRIFEQWIARGAPDARTPESAGTASATGMPLEDGRRFWSFQPVGDPAIPVVKESNWVQSPIDAFVLYELERHQIQPAPPADRLTLIRRVTFDLTGLPPTQAEVQAFLADDSQEAFREVVERLLASPQYGVHWGRHWLDVARYADSNGLDENLAYGNAWRYRDYVVAAFNQDKPYNRFVTEQLAGDLLPEANEETHIATGFLALGAKVLAEPDMEKLVMDTIDEQLDTIGKAFMGMTLGCVRCHDHKFDPIYQSDYYALAAILKSTRTFAESRTGAIKHWYEYSFATEAESEALKEADAAVAKANAAANAFKNQAVAVLRKEAQEKVVEYLVAAAKLTPAATLHEVEIVAEPLGLHPRILHQCRLYLQHHRSEPLFQIWHELSNHPQELEEYYRGLVERMRSAQQETLQVNPTQKGLTDPELEALRVAIADPVGLLTVPPQPEFAFDAPTLSEYYRLQEAARVVESNAMDEPAAMGVSEQVTLESLPIHIRGSHLNLGEPVSREFPAVMRASTVRPVFPAAQSGRVELANWLASTVHPLTARVMVNRVWGWHFGQAMVRTTENFGVLGDRPSHPGLLDWLAREWMKRGWSVKELHRMILMSSTYQMSSTHPQADNWRELDPENRLLWKFPQRRLSVEQIRDAVLSVSGQLDSRLDGKSVPLRNRQFVFNHTSQDHTKYDSLRRTLYLPIIRNNLYTWLEQFDFPDPTMPTGHRNTTTVAPQALLMLNSDLVLDSAEELANRVQASSSANEERIEWLYQQLFSRPPQPIELERCLAFVMQDQGFDSHRQSVDPALQHQAWVFLCQSLLASNEFIYVR